MKLPLNRGPLYLGQYLEGICFKQQGLTTLSQQQMMNVATQVATGKVTEVPQIAKMLIK